MVAEKKAEIPDIHISPNGHEPTPKELFQIEQSGIVSEPFDIDPGNASDGLISLHLRDIRRFGLLNPDQETKLARSMERGKKAQVILGEGGFETSPSDRAKLQREIHRGLAAREQLIKSNLRFAIKEAKRHQGRGLPLEDLIQVAHLGLGKGVDRFDWRRGNRVCTYASWWINREIDEAIRDNARTISLSRTFQNSRVPVIRTHAALTQELGHEPTNSELASATNLPVDEIGMIMNPPQASVSLDAGAGEEKNTPVSEFIQDKNAPDPFEEAAKSSRRTQLDLAFTLAGLTPREESTVRKHFGLTEDGIARSLREVGKEQGVCRERASQIEDDAIKKLRRPDVKRMLKDYLD